MLPSPLKALLSVRKKKPYTNQTTDTVVADWIEVQWTSGEVEACPTLFAEQEGRGLFSGSPGTII